MDSRTRTNALKDDRTQQEISNIQKGINQPNLFKLEEKERANKIAFDKFYSKAEERTQKQVQQESNKLTQMASKAKYVPKKLAND